MKDRNQLLLDFASDWTLDGDLLRCRSCKRAQIASRQDEDFVHRSDCEKNRTGGRPWTVLQSILLTMPSGQSVMDQLAAANAQRDELKCEMEQLDIYLRCRGASGETVLDRVKRMERDGTAAESFWQKAQARADMLQQQLGQCVLEREALAKSYRETIDQRDELIRRAQLAVWQGLTCEKPHELIPGEPLRAQLIVLGELCGAIARAQSGQPAQRDDDGTESGGGVS